MDDDENLSMLLSMGFPDIGEIKRALRLAKNDINEAVAILTMEQPLSSYGTVDDLRDVNADIDMRDVNASGSTFIGPMNATAAQQRPGSSTTDEGDKGGDGNSLEFPATNLYELEQRVFQDNWSIPYKREESLGKCLVACTKLAKDGLLTDEAMDSECRKFIDRVMPEAFRKLLTSNATFRWHTEIQEGIYNMLELFIDLILARLPHAPVPVSMLGTLAVALDLDNDWNSKNKDQTSMGRWQEDDRSSSTRTEYARAAGITSNRYGWLCDLINQFGDGDGFKILADCFRQENVTARDMAALLRPLGNSAEVLNKDVLHSLLTPCMELAFARVGKIGDAELRTKEVMAVSDLLMALKLCCHHFWPECTEQCDRQRLDMICRMLKTPQFNTRMNGLKEVSRLIEESDQPQLNHRYRSIINISSERLVDWMAENKVLTVALEGNIDQVQYTDRIKAIVEFLCPRLGTDDLDKMWQLQDSSPNSQIMENVYAIMASAASKFNLNQFEHLTTLIKKKWEASNDRVREKLLVLIGQIGREAKQTESIQATLQLLWEVSHLKTLPRHLVERALSEQLAIITEMNQSRDSQRRTYINECVEDIKQGEKLTVLPAVMHLHKLCKSYSKGSSSVYQKADKATLGELNRKHEIVKLLSVSLSRGHVWAVEIAGRKNGLKKDTIVDGRYTHDEFVSEHLKLMKFFLQEGDLYLSWGRSKEIWETLVDNRKAISFDQELCFNWFKECLADLENETQLDFFNQKLLSLSASAVSNSSFECFREYLESVNVNASKIRKNLSSSFVVESLEPIGQNYLWTLVTDCPDESIANEAIDYLLKLSFLCVSPKLKKDSATLHKKFINQCYHRLETVIDMPLSTEKHEAVQEGCEVETSIVGSNLEPAQKTTTSVSKNTLSSINAKGIRLQMIRRLVVLAERYVSSVEEVHVGNRLILPHAATFHGQPIRIKILYEPRKDEFSIESHSNELVCSVKRHVAELVQHQVDDLTFQCGDLSLGSGKDKCLIGTLGGDNSDGQTWSVKLNNLHATTSSSSSGPLVAYNEDKSSGATLSASALSSDMRPSFMDELEKVLPGVIIATGDRVFAMLYQLATLNDSNTLKAIRRLFHLIPTDPCVTDSLDSVSYGAEASHQASADASPKMSPRKMLTSLPLPESAREHLSQLFDVTAPGKSPLRVLYNLEVLSGRLMPTRQQEPSQQLSHDFLKADGLKVILSLFDKDSLPPDVDYDIRQSIYIIALQIARYLLCGQTVIQRNYIPSSSSISSNQLLSSPMTKPTPPKKSALDATASTKSPIALSASKIVQTMSEAEFTDTVSCLMRVVWAAAAGNLHLATSNTYTMMSRQGEGGQPMRVFASRRSRDSSTGSSTGSESGAFQNNGAMGGSSGVSDSSTSRSKVNIGDAQIAAEAFDMLATCLQLRSQNIAAFYNLPFVTEFIVETLLGSVSSQVRKAACSQLIRLSRIRTPSAVRSLNLDGDINGSNTHTKHSSRHMLTKILLKAPVPLWMPSCKARGTSHALLGQCTEYFELRSYLLDGLTMREQEALGENSKLLLDDELTFLHNYATCGRLEDCTLLAGHLRLVEALLSSDGVSLAEVGDDIIPEVLDAYLFPASQLISDGVLNASTSEGNDSLLQARSVNPKCDTPDSRVAAYNLLVQLAKDCPQNLAVIVQSLVRMHHFYDEALAKEFAYEPLVERRAGCNYVGLKNAGATCYMNSVLQQLYTVPGVCKAVLNNFDDLYEDGDVGKDGAEDETVFYQLQNVFGHLLESKLQHYIPEKFWHTFRLFGQPVNVREQQDAFEFFTQIVDQVDEFLTSKKRPKLFSEHFEGVFSDQMLCQGCPHRYEREQSFMALNLTVKSNSLQESLDQFVRGELLEGDNAYLCEKCQEKRSTTKRMCIRKLPKTLVIQLKRFHYDWETNRAVKFDEYFEFPWSLDMGPYTTEGIQKAEKAAAAAQTTNNSDDDGKPSEKRASIASPPPPVFATSANRKLSFSKAFAKEVHSYPYDLVGVVVHSGQANAGHYYSFIRDRNSRNKWLKFNDTTVEEFEMTEETMKQECFGGSFKVKKPSASSSLPENRQRYWNAYMLFYECRRTSEMRQAEKKSHAQSASMVLGTPHSGSRKTSTPAAAPRESLSQLSDLLEKGEKTGLFNKVGGRMPSRIERGIQEENLRFLQNRDVYCEDYYRFVYDLASANRNPSKANRTPLAIESVKLAVNFFLNSYCHVKRRQKAMLGDIIDTIDDCLESSAPATQWLLGFLANVDGLRYFRPFLLECSAREVRVNFYHLVEKALAYFHRHNNCNTDTEDVNRLLATMAGLVKDDVANHIKTCGQFFSLLNKFASLGVAQCQQLFQLKVFNATVKLLLGIIPAEVDGDNKSNRQRRWAPSQCRELGELHMTLSCLILACDTTPFRAVGGDVDDGGSQLASRVFKPSEKKCKMPTCVSAVLYGNLGSLFIREAVCACREVTSTAVPNIIEMLVHVSYCSTSFSQLLIEEIMRQYNSVNSGELKNLSTLLIEVLTLSDPLQSSRLNYAIDGKEDAHIDGLLTLVDKNQTSDSCRAYQCIKTLVAAANKSSTVKERLLQDPEKWQWAVNWLKEKMDKDGGAGGSSSTSGIGSTASGTTDMFWSTDSTSNEDSLTRTFHRTTSAVVTLEEANALLAEFDQPASSEESGRTTISSTSGDQLTLMDTDEVKHNHGEDDEIMPDLQEVNN